MKGTKLIDANGSNLDQIDETISRISYEIDYTEHFIQVIHIWIEKSLSH